MKFSLVSGITWLLFNLVLIILCIIETVSSNNTTLSYIYGVCIAVNIVSALLNIRIIMKNKELNI